VDGNKNCLISAQAARRQKNPGRPVCICSFLGGRAWGTACCSFQVHLERWIRPQTRTAKPRPPGKHPRRRDDPGTHKLLGFPGPSGESGRNEGGTRPARQVARCVLAGRGSTRPACLCAKTSFMFECPVGSRGIAIGRGGSKGEPRWGGNWGVFARLGGRVDQRRGP